MVITRNRGSIYKHGTPRFVFFPGANHVPEDVGALLLEDAKFQTMIKDGAFSVEATAAKGEDVVVAVRKLNATKATDFVRKCLRLDSLKELLAAEERTTVRAAIEEQIKMLKENDATAANNTNL